MSSSAGPSDRDAHAAAKRRPISEWYGSSRYDWFMLGIVLGAAWASLVWWLFA